MNYILYGKAAIVLLTVRSIKRYSLNEWILSGT